MNGKFQQQEAKRGTILKGDLHMKHYIVLPPEVAQLGKSGFVYVTSLTKGEGVSGYIVSPDGLERIIHRVELTLRTLPSPRSAEQIDWMVIASHYGLDVLSKVPVRDRKIAPPITHLLAPAGPLWFLPRDGYAFVSSVVDDFNQHEISLVTIQSAAARLATGMRK
jgi:hypothetical protein